MRRPHRRGRVEYLLQQSAPDPFLINVDGVAGPDLLTGIVDFQTRALGQSDPDGLIKPRDSVAQLLARGAGAGKIPIEAIRWMVPDATNVLATLVGPFMNLYRRQFGAA